MITQEKFNEFTYQDIRLDMFWSGRGDKRGHPAMEYRLFKGDTLLIEGDDFSPGIIPPDSIDAVVSLLSFLTLKPGDTDAAYFAKYSPEMLAFVNSNQCEEIKMLTGDFEDSDADFKINATDFFEEHCKINVA